MPITQRVESAVKEDVRLLPLTEAEDQKTSEFAVLPGYPAYSRWSDLLSSGQISYDEFVDWTTVRQQPSRAEQLKEFLQTVLEGLRGGVYGRR